MTLARKIKSAREAKGLGLREAARAMKISPTYLCRLEQGKVDAPSAERIVELSRCYGIPLSELFYACNTRRQDDIVGYVLRKWRSLSACRAQVLRGMDRHYGES
jgi:transcriptional regulator with XRE-family HTH domain